MTKIKHYEFEIINKVTGKKTTVISLGSQNKKQIIRDFNTPKFILIKESIKIKNTL